ncbi:bidirectional hydrogenase complex protein HoxU [Thioalkalicoccus limnaeus]|uniref:NADH-quinone oxidoreductase subunit G n=1 Tax=Thioalkalicoccus limnaeus TaxID=120681 RepID=A0ABV4BIE0_9GAMM
MSMPVPQSSVRVVTFQIDGRDYSGREDETIIEVARENRIPIPSLCYLEGLSVWGGCRLCLVELVGSNRLVAACSTRVAEDMQILTDTERLRHYRRTIVELLFAERNHICSVCVSNGHCELQDLAQRCGVDHVQVPYRHASYRVDASHEMFRLDHNRCVLCTRCVRVCDEIEGAHTWDVMGRGSDCLVITDMHQPWGQSETCTSCGKCVHACPTGALVKQGTSVGEMTKDLHFLPYITRRRHIR